MAKKKRAPTVKMSPVMGRPTDVTVIVENVVGRCELFSTLAMACPLCRVTVPARTSHTCTGATATRPEDPC